MTSRRIVIRGAAVIATQNAAGEELAGADILIEDGVISAIGAVEVPEGAEVVEARGAVVTPGLINTHHHMFQSLTRAVPAGQDALLFGWLRALYPIWAQMTPEDIRLSTTLALAELALSGCSLSADHLYLYPNGARLDDSLEGAEGVGLRFHATRGSMSIGESDGGLPPDALVEKETAILADCERVLRAYHDPAPGAMRRIGLAPCSPFSVSQGLMRDTAVLAREHGVRMHTHLAENAEDVAYSQAQFGCRPGAYAEDLGWVGRDVWHAHCVMLEAREISLFAHSGTGVAHCPCSNGRLGSGIAPVRALRDAGVPVGLGVDGSASNDAADLMGEARQMMLLQRIAQGADAFSAREALAVATRGGAEVLGWPDLGVLAPGYRADIAIWPVDDLMAAGAWDPVAALVLTGPRRVRHLLVEGRMVVRDGRLTNVDVPRLLEQVHMRVQRLTALSP